MATTENWPTSMDEVADRVLALDPEESVADVVGWLQDIEREKEGFFDPDGPGPVERAARRPPPDGVAAFNGLYLRVTQAVQAHIESCRAPEFVARLDVVFASFYLQAYAAATAHEWVSKAWAPLFERKDDRDILPLQFAIAGMNAHINNDLAFALVQTWRELGVTPNRSSPEYQDFDDVNDTLRAVEQQVKPLLSRPFVRHVDIAAGHVDDWLALWSVAKAREEAWERAEKMLADPDREYDTIHDRAIGFVSHLLLVPHLARL